MDANTTGRPAQHGGRQAKEFQSLDLAADQTLVRAWTKVMNADRFDLK